MNRKAWMAVSLIPCICMIAVVGVSAFLGGCDKLIECSSADVPMRCHWAYRGTAVIGGLGLVVSACAAIAKDKEARRLLAVCSLAAAAAAVLCLTSAGIGICPSGMECQSNASIVRGLCAVSALASIVLLIKANPEQAELPKLGI